MTLSLAGKGFAVAYATVAVGDVADEMRNARGAVDALRKDTTRPYLAKSLDEPEVMFVLGQADTALMVGTSDFRSVFALRYPRAAALASAVNWVFSVPYEIDELRPPVDEPESLRFVLHLRLRRAVYAYREAEEKIVRRLALLLARDDIPARIHAGLGWSDLIVEGRFTRATFEKLIAFIINAHGLRLRIGDDDKAGVSVLQRMLTVLGYTSEKPPPFGGTDHITFLRALPGGYDKIVEKLGKFGEGIFILDGKADFLVTTHDAPDDWLEAQRTLGEEENRALLQKVETHLMYFPAQKFDNASAGDRLWLPVGAETLHRPKCECETERDTFTTVIDRRLDQLEKVIPQEHRQAIDNILFLLSAALRDARSLCCDVRDAVRACFHGLLTILDEIGEKDAHITRVCAGTGTAAIHMDMRAQYDELAALWRRLDEWHRFADLLLRQRTVGSYEEILGQSDRSVVYSGGVQKFLYLADSLLNQFAKRLDAAAPPFATIYDSVKTILSLPTGLVRIPTTSIFKFPPSVVELWHEAATTLFRLRYAQQIVAATPAGEDQKLFAVNLGDHYGDLLVYLHGFGGSFEKFLASLAYGFQQIYGETIYPVRARAYRHFLTRVYLVYEFDRVREARDKRDRARLRQFLREPEKVAATLIAELRSMFAVQKVALRYPSLDFPDVYWDLLELPVTSEDFSLFHRNLYLHFLQTPTRTARPKLQEFERGELKTFSGDDDLNDHYAELAHYIQAFERDDSLPYFKMMAALGKSAAIEFHRRQISR